MARVQLALNVSNLEASIEFYTVTDDNPLGTSTLTSLKLAETGGACCAPGQC